MSQEKDDPALHHAKRTVAQLQSLLSDATPMQALVLLPIIERAVKTEMDVRAYLGALMLEK